MCAMWIPGRVRLEGERTERWKPGAMVSRIKCKLYVALCRFREILCLGGKKSWSATNSVQLDHPVLSYCPMCCCHGQPVFFPTYHPLWCPNSVPVGLIPVCQLLPSPVGWVEVDHNHDGQRAHGEQGNAGKLGVVGMGALSLHHFAAFARKTTSAGHAMGADPEVLMCCHAQG